MFVVSPWLSTDCMCGLDPQAPGRPRLLPAEAGFGSSWGGGGARATFYLTLQGGLPCITHASHMRCPALSGGVRRNFLML